MTLDFAFPRPSSIDRRVHRRGTHAYSWLREHGWQTDGSQRSDAMVYADEVRTPTVVARRLHASALTLCPVEGEGTTRTLFLLQAEGSTRVAFRDGSSTIVEPLGYAAAPLADVALVSSQRPVARIEVVADLPLFPAGGIHVSPPAHRMAVAAPRSVADGQPSPSPASWHVISSVVNAVLNSDLSADSAALLPLETSLLHALVSLLVESRGAGLPARHASHLSHAQEIIQRNAHQPDFSVEHLAATMNISTRYLARLFREVGTSPGRALRAARVSRAQLALHGGAPSLDDAARAAGFSSVRAMKEAFRLSGLSLGS